MPIKDQISERLVAVLNPEALEVMDESEDHRGHSGWKEDGETHFRVRLQAEALAGLSRIERHRAVHNAIGAELIGRIHALAIEIV